MTNTDSPGGLPARQTIKKNTISFEIIDETTGDPVDGVSLDLIFGDGPPKTVTVRKNGRIKISLVPDGTCTLKACRMKRQVLMEVKENRTLMENDTLSAIANHEKAGGNDITWQDIALFNWGDLASDSKRCAEFMRDDLGCFSYADNLGAMAYKKGEKTHTLDIPRAIERKNLALNTLHQVPVRIRKTPPQFLSCCGIPNITFTFADSFIRPNTEKYLKTLKEKISKHPGAKLMIFGHTDKVGDEAFNKGLSERRAKSAYSLITKNPDYWVTLYKYSASNPDNEDWGVKSVQTILNYLNPEAHLDLSNTLDERTIEEIETHVSPAFENTHFGKRIPDSSLKKIFQAYFDKLMEGSDIKESDFLTPKYAGCSELNPIIDIDRAEEDNRRVTFFLFDKERLPKIPCKEGDLAPCNNQCAQYRKNKTTYRKKKTFACAFYDSIAKDCDQEVILPDIIHIDSHMHFMTGQTTPLPLLWNQLPLKAGKLHLRRKNLNAAGKMPKIFGFARGAETGAQNTLTIATRGAHQNQSVYDKIYPVGPRNLSGRKMLTPMISMPMDMSFSHIDGYRGKPIYTKVLSRYFYIREYWVMEGDIPVYHYDTILLWPDELAKELNGLKDTPAQVVKDQQVNVKDIQEEKRERDSQANEGFYYYLDRKDENEEIVSIRDKTPRWLDGEEIDMFVDWDEQEMDTIAAAIKYPFRYMPMYHYEPRRWMNSNGPDKGSAGFEYPARWDIPFSQIVTPSKTGVFIGFKMYTALGYKPDDYRAWGKSSAPRLPRLWDFYDKCQTEQIPVLCHCSPSGMCTHDIKLYFDLEIDKNLERYKRLLWFDRKKDWYYDHFVSPEAWLKVLRDFNKLKLCLAHFGGGSSFWKDWKNNTLSALMAREHPEAAVPPPTEADIDKIVSGWYERKDYNKDNWIKQIVDIMDTRDTNGDYKYPNFYTDISYHFIRDHSREFEWIIRNHPIVKERILFGTDWYMTELDKKSIEKFIREVKEAIDKVSKILHQKTGVHEDLWHTFTCVNPMKFFGIRGIADNFAKGLRKEGDMKQDKLKKQYGIDAMKMYSLIDPNLKIINNSDMF